MGKKDEIIKRIAKHWDQVASKPGLTRTRWWNSDQVNQHINRLISGHNSSGFGDGLLKLVQKKAQGRIFESGISVGCGLASKELRILQTGLVKSFDLYEFSSRRIAAAQQKATELGLADRVTFHQKDALQEVNEQRYDFVHWDNSLHHMLDVDQAIRWSHNILQAGGMFYLNDFVGPSRFQWSDASLELAGRIRSLLPPAYLKNPHKPEEQVSLSMNRPTPEIMDQDPSEAAQSEQIFESLLRYFPDAEIKKTGGTVYHLPLNDILHNFDENDATDTALLSLLLLIDELCIQIPKYDNHYATAIAIKN